MSNGRGSGPYSRISSEEREELERLLGQLYEESAPFAAWEASRPGGREAEAATQVSREELVQRLHAVESSLCRLYRIVRLVFEKTELLRVESGRGK